MKTRVILTYVFLLIIICQALYGQAECCCKSKDKSNYEPGLSGELFTMPLDTLSTFNKFWFSGDIFLVDGEIIRSKYIKYSGLLDELFWFEPKSRKTIKLDKEAILQFHFLNVQGDTTVYFRKIKVKRDIFTDTSETYCQVVFEGSLSLLILHTYKLLRSDVIRKNGNLFENTIYKEEPIYIIKLAANNTFITKRLNRKKLCAFVPGKKDLINEFFKHTKLRKIKTYPDMLTLMKFLNSIADM